MGEINWVHLKIDAQDRKTRQWTIVYRKFESTPIGNPHLAIPQFVSFFSKPPVSARLFQQYRPNEILGRHKNKLTRQSWKSQSQKVKINIPNQRIVEERALLLQNPHVINEKQCLSPLYRQPSYIEYPAPPPLPPAHFLQGNLDPLLLWFSKNLEPFINKTEECALWRLMV